MKITVVEGFTNSGVGKSGYPASTSYQEKYLKKIQSDSANRTGNNKNDSYFGLLN